MCFIVWVFYFVLFVVYWFKLLLFVLGCACCGCGIVIVGFVVGGDLGVVFIWLFEGSIFCLFVDVLVELLV